MSSLIFRSVRSGQLLSLVTAGAPEGGLSGGCQGAILSSRRLNVKKEISIIYHFKVNDYAGLDQPPLQAKKKIGTSGQKSGLGSVPAQQRGYVAEALGGNVIEAFHPVTGQALGRGNAHLLHNFVRIANRQGKWGQAPWFLDAGAASPHHRLAQRRRLW